MSNTVKGRDLATPEKKIVVCGKEYDLKFSLMALTVAENVYEDTYKKDVDARVIIMDMSKGKLRASLALLYGFAVAGGMDMPFEEFQNGLDLSMLKGVNNVVQDGIISMMPQASEQKNV